MENVRKYLAYMKKMCKESMYMKLKVIQWKWLGDLMRKYLCADTFKMVNETALETIERWLAPILNYDDARKK